MNISINIKYLLIFSFVFILFTVIGTISHEYGHIAVAKYFGYETVLHYGSMNYYPKGYLDDKDVIEYNSLTKEYANIKYNSLPENVKQKADTYFNILHNRYSSEKSNNSLLVSMGGPIQTMLTGIIGFFILYTRRKTMKQNGLKYFDWFAVFLSLFWLREVFNLFTSIGSKIISSKGTWFGGDELYISRGLNLWDGTIPITLGVLGLLIVVYVVFKIVPKKIRLTFILSGIIGGITGFILWMNIIGPKIMP